MTEEPALLMFLLRYVAFFLIGVFLCVLFIAVRAPRSGYQPKGPGPRTAEEAGPPPNQGSGGRRDNTLPGWPNIMVPPRPRFNRRTPKPKND